VFGELPNGKRSDNVAEKYRRTTINSKLPVGDPQVIKPSALLISIVLMQRRKKNSIRIKNLSPHLPE
jgi:hypothetical protein